MRLTALLDNITAQGGSGPWTPHQPLTTPLGSSDAAEFDRLLAGLLPCRTNDPELWFAEQSTQVEQAKALCQACPLVAGCLAGAIERQEPWGVWGGEVFVDGAVVARKRGRGRPSKAEVLARQAEEAARAAARESEDSVSASSAA
ncbi:MULTISPECIES: WhiB family transcriptional regulator [unclassified Oerskovia]|uniref:WhiB family transcriptional regulator n=1 Tax=unclassified Oerskovia TaxID=2619021 RepID=UPI00110E5518|nr:WhiB family transcriptional regulator [Oerskovia sp. KBS0722]QDW62764.1 WhiB family transcriptional regulator [Oerskovia sp. KBS0722]